MGSRVSMSPLPANLPLQGSVLRARLPWRSAMPSTTDPLAGGTPILDRQAPLPQPRPGSRLPFILGIGLCLVILALIVWLPPFVEVLRRQIEPVFPGPWSLSRIGFVAL